MYSSHKIYYTLSSLYQWNTYNKFTICSYSVYSSLIPSLMSLQDLYCWSFLCILLSWFLTFYFPWLLLSIWSFFSSHHCGLFFFRLSLTTEFMALSSIPLIHILSRVTKVILTISTMSYMMTGLTHNRCLLKFKFY